MDNIYEYLKLDHKKVDKLFTLYETSPSEKNKLEIVEMLNKELLVHAISEEKTFYKVLEEHRKSKKEAFHGEHEHQKIKDTLANIITIKHVNKSFDNKIKDLKKLIEHHVSDEEGKLFKEAKKVLTDYEAYIIKEQMHYLKGKLLLEKFSD